MGNEETKPKKKAATDHPIHELLKERWSPRSFSDEPVAEEKLNQLFEAARWAPSSYNEQPELCDLPDDFMPLTMFPIGYRGEADSLEDAWRSNTSLE